MTAHPVPDVDCDSQHATLSVRDIGSAVEFYIGKLGFRLGFTWGASCRFVERHPIDGGEQTTS